MNENEAVAAIRAFFASGWGSLTPVLYDDEEKAIPESGTWVRLNIRHTLGDQTTMGAPGNNRHEQQGGITVQIFQPEGQASKDARAKLAAATAIFRGKTTQNIHFYQTTPREIGSDGRGYYQVNVDIRFRYSIFA